MPMLNVLNKSEPNEHELKLRVKNVKLRSSGWRRLPAVKSG
jgi:hypothetical protein